MASALPYALVLRAVGLYLLQGPAIASGGQDSTRLVVCQQTALLSLLIYEHAAILPTVLLAAFAQQPSVTRYEMMLPVTVLIVFDCTSAANFVALCLPV